MALEVPILFRHIGKIDLLSSQKSGKLKQRMGRLKQTIRSKQIERDQEKSSGCVAITLSYLQHEHYLLLDMTLEAPVLFSC